MFPGGPDLRKLHGPTANLRSGDLPDVYKVGQPPERLPGRAVSLIFITFNCAVYQPRSVLQVDACFHSDPDIRPQPTPPLRHSSGFCGRTVCCPGQGKS